MTTRSTVLARLWFPCAALLLFAQPMQSQPNPDRPRARETGIVVGSLSTGPLNAITDVPGVRVGQTTLHESNRLHTGVTAILPHGDNLFQERVPAAIHVGNGFGKLLGATQVQELGELETPILLTSTLSVWRAGDAMVDWLLNQPGMAEVRSINPVVGETNDGFLNDIRARVIAPAHVRHALETATNGPVAEGSVGAGAGTIAFGWKGGIGTSSRKLTEKQGGYTVGVIVQSNFGGDLTINGVHIRLDPDEKQAGVFPSRATLAANEKPGNSGDGSIMIVLATDAPLDPRKLQRLAARTMVGLARTGSNMSNGSGDYAIAFSTALECRRIRGESLSTPKELANDSLTPLFEAAADATEEAIYNSLFRATTVHGLRGTAWALPIDRVRDLISNESKL